MITQTVLNISSSTISSTLNTAKRIDPFGKSICETAKRALKNVDEKTKQLLNGSNQEEQFNQMTNWIPSFEFNLEQPYQLLFPYYIDELALGPAPQMPPQYYLNLLNPNQQDNNQLEIDPP